jgi:glycosyltransferase 2 family protein
LRTRLLLAAKVAVSLALLAYLFSTTDLAALKERIRTGDTFLLVFCMAIYGLIIAISIWRWKLLLHTQGYRATMSHLSASYLVATFFNNFLPSNIGGDVIRVRDSSRLTGSTTASVAVVIIDRILGFGALYALAVVAYAAGGPSVRGLAGALPTLIGLAAVFGSLAYIFFRAGTARRGMALLGLTQLPWARSKFEVVQNAVHVYRAEVGAVWTALLGSIALQALVVYYYYNIARSLHIPLPLSVCFLMVPLVSLVQALPISFNGWGVRESIFILYFTQIGLPRESAMAFSLVGAGLMVLLSLSGAVVWTSRGETAAAAVEDVPH